MNNLIITGRCSICKAPIGLLPDELGKLPPPEMCATCNASTLGYSDMASFFEGLFRNAGGKGGGR